MALNRSTNETVKVKRMPGKIALEEAVGSPFFDALCTYPRAQIVHDVDSMNFCDEFMQDSHQRLHDIDLRLKSMDQSGIGYAIVSPTTPGIEGILDSETAVDFARRTNDAIYEK